MRVLFALLALAASVATVSAQGWTGPNFYIVGNTATSSYNFSINGVIVNNPSFNLTVGTTYKFILNASLNFHPFGFSADGLTMSNATDASVGGMTLSGSCGAGQNADTLSWITTAGNEANPCIVSFTPPAAAVGQPPIFYRCSLHSAMKGNLTAVAAGAAVTTAPPTTPAPSGTGNGTTAPPTSTPAPTGSSSSTGKGNGAAVLVPGAAVFIFAAINALFA